MVSDRNGSLYELLALAAELVDLEHILHSRERCLRAFACEPVDRPPLVVQPAFGASLTLPEPFDRFQPFSYSETYNDPAAMMHNQVLQYVVPGLLMKDDSPLAIRNNHGTIQVASALGGRWKMHEDNYPWVEPFESTEPIERIVNEGVEITQESGILRQSLDTLRFYRQRLSEHPPLDEAVCIAMPDLQGPLDTAEQLWGSGIYLEFADRPEMVGGLMERVVDAMLLVAGWFRPLTHDPMAPDATVQHGYVIPGRLLIRNDSSLMLSPGMYREYVLPHDTRLLEAMGTGSIHCCGEFGHLIEPMLEIEPLRGIDFGQSWLNDVASAYAECARRGVALTRVVPARDELASGRAAADYPTGALFVYETSDWPDAVAAAGEYRSSAGC